MDADVMRSRQGNFLHTKRKKTYGKNACNSQKSRAQKFNWRMDGASALAIALNISTRLSNIQLEVTLKSITSSSCIFFSFVFIQLKSVRCRCCFLILLLFAISCSQQPKRRHTYFSLGIFSAMESMNFRFYCLNGFKLASHKYEAECVWVHV